MFLRWVALAIVLAAWAMQASAVELSLTADAHVNAARPSSNSGAISNLNVGAGYTVLLAFDPGALPSGTTAAQITRALLRLYCNRADAPGVVALRTIASDWSEYSVTYESLPALSAPSQTFTVSSDGAYLTVDVTALVQAWVASPSTNHGIALTSDAAVVQFDSKENDLTGHAPTLEVVLASQGPAGPKGDTGATGPQGPVGPAGPAGPVGPQGPKGDTGPQGPAGPAGSGSPGPTGPQGPPGPTGPAGPVGPAGPAGMTFRGEYSLDEFYGAGDSVLYGGSGYISLADENHGNLPDLTPSAWGKYASGVQGPVGPPGADGAVGPAGPQGIPGPAGPSGPAGATGPVGPQGPQGPVGMTFRGAYSSSVSYSAGDGVSYEGAGYVSLGSNNLGNAPDQNPSVWGKFAAGTPGPAGPQGVAGPQGPIGPAGPAGPPGATGATGLMGPQGPQGATGPAGAPGATGPQGPAGVNFRGAWDSGASYLAHDAVFYNGSTYLALVTSQGAAPDIVPAAWTLLAQAGSAGATGPTGAAATVSIGTVTTVAPGTPATVTNSGTSTAAVLNFAIPQGAPGASGGGGAGSSGIAFASIYHSVSFTTFFYSVSSASQSATEDGSVLTWVPSGCNATSLSVYSQQVNPITVTLRTGVPGAMANSALVCQVASNSSCLVSNVVPIPAGGFIDLRIDGANGTPSAVWTALTCN